jgi:DNA-binding CsgD family transcriptional regulator
MRTTTPRKRAKPPLPTRGRVPTEPLTPREIQVARLLSLGCSARDVAAILKISPHTADNFRTRIMQKLRTTKAATLTRVVLRLRISSLNDELTAAERRRLR